MKSITGAFCTRGAILCHFIRSHSERRPRDLHTRDRYMHNTHTHTITHTRIQIMHYDLASQRFVIHLVAAITYAIIQRIAHILIPSLLCALPGGEEGGRIK